MVRFRSVSIHLKYWIHIHTFGHKYLLDIYYVLDIVPDLGDKEVYSSVK